MIRHLKCGKERKALGIHAQEGKFIVQQKDDEPATRKKPNLFSQVQES